MKVVLFDLGETLEHNGNLREDALETLEKIEDMKDSHNQFPILGLASDFGLASTEEEIKRSKESYYNIIRNLGIYHFFEPVEQNVTLSTEVGTTKDENLQKFIQIVIEKIGNTSFNQIIFITENIYHINAAKSLGIKTIHLNLNDNYDSNNQEDTISKLKDAINMIENFVKS
jgi:FMN phosphatase YigB (HAD superfamily)